MHLPELDQKIKNQLIVIGASERSKLLKAYKAALLAGDLGRAVHVQTKMISLNNVLDDI